jgi:hypothetical protein
MFKEVGAFPNLGTVLCKGNPVFTFVVGFISLWFVMRFLFQFFLDEYGNYFLHFVDSVSLCITIT